MGGSGAGGGWGGNDHPPRLLTDLCGSKLTGDISGFEPTAGGRRLARRLVARHYLMELFS